MSTQYGTLTHRKTVQVPMWFIVALVVGMLAIGSGYAVERFTGQEAVVTTAVTSFPDTQVAARESFAAPQTSPAFPSALETSGIFPGGTAGGEERGTSGNTSGTSQPITINGSVCHQCR
jgi:hypothetical protein